MADDAILPQVKNALLKENGTITDTPYTIACKSDRFYADICIYRKEAGTAWRVIVAEVKSFGSQSPMREFEQALRPYEMRRDLLKINALTCEISLAVDADVYAERMLRLPFPRICEQHPSSLLLVETETEEIVQWIRKPNTPR